MPKTEKWQLEALIDICIRLTAPGISTGEDELERDEGRKGIVDDFERWGGGALDELLGGWDGRGVLEVAGPQRTGKSVRAHSYSKYVKDGQTPLVLRTQS